MRRGGGPPQAVSSCPTTTGLPFPQCAQETLTKLAKHVRLCGSHKHRGMIAQYSEYQQLIDNDVFSLTQDQWRITKLNPLQQLKLLDVFIRFFKEKADDPQKNAYFDLIFLGREGDQQLHDQRVDVLLNFASYALQTPVFQVYIMISQWLSKPSTPRIYGERLIALLVDHFIKPDPGMKMYQFLLPLEIKCAEFTAFFVVYAHRFSPITVPLATVMGSYLSVNVNYLLCQFRDSSWMATEFSKEVFPKCLRYVLTEDNTVSGWSEWNTEDQEANEKARAISTLSSGIIQLLQRWHTKVKDCDPNYDSVFDKSLQWSSRRREFISTIAFISPAHCSIVKQNLEKLNVPKQYSEEIAESIPMISSSV